MVVEGGVLLLGGGGTTGSVGVGVSVGDRVPVAVGVNVDGGGTMVI